MKKVVFSFVVISISFLGFMTSSFAADKGVYTDWLNDELHSTYETEGCQTEPGRKFINNYDKLDPVIEELSKWYKHFFITTDGACDTTITIYILSEETYDDVIFFRYGDDDFRFGRNTTGSMYYKLYNYDFADIEDFDINDIISDTWDSVVNGNHFVGVFYEDNTNFLYYSSFDVLCLGFTNVGSTFTGIWYFNDTKYNFKYVSGGGDHILPTVYELLHPDFDIKFYSLPILNDNEVVESIEVRAYPNIINDKLYHYLYSFDGENWTSVLMSDKSYFSGVFNENGDFYVKVFDKNVDPVWTGSYKVEGIGLTESDYENEYGAIGEYGSSDVDNDIFSPLKDHFYKLFDTVFKFFAWIPQLFQLFDTWSYDEKIDGDCSYVDSNGETHRMSCNKLASWTINFSFLPFDVGDNIPDVPAGRYFIMWFDEHRDTVFFWERLIMATIVVIALIGGKGYSNYLDAEVRRINRKRL